MLEESLGRLGTDHLDLWQIHAVVYDNDPDLVYRKDGVIEAQFSHPSGSRPRTSSSRTA